MSNHHCLPGRRTQRCTRPKTVPGESSRFSTRRTRNSRDEWRSWKGEFLPSHPSSLSPFPLSLSLSLSICLCLSSLSPFSVLYSLFTPPICLFSLSLSPSCSPSPPPSVSSFSFSVSHSPPPPLTTLSVSSVLPSHPPSLSLSLSVALSLPLSVGTD